MGKVEMNHNGVLYYQGDTFRIEMTRYTDPNRKNLARNAARYLGKKDIDNTRRPLSIVRQGHVPEIFRGEFAEFEFVDVSKEVYDHLITYTTRNMRVAGGNRALVSDDFTMPSDKVKDPERVRDNILRAMDGYKDNLEAGETPQVSRSAMPIGAKLNTFVFQFNFLTLGQSVFRQRLWEKGAQGNTVKVVQGMFELCYHMDKELWDTFYKYMGTPAVEWTEVRKKLEKKGFTIRDLMSNIYEDMKEDGDTGVSLDTKVSDYLVDLFGEQKTMW